MLRQLRVGARDNHSPAGHLRNRGPYLLSAEDPFVPISNGPGRKCCNVGCRLRAR